MKKKQPRQKTASEIKRMPLVFQVDLRTFAENGEMPKEIQVLPVGEWSHPVYGPIKITREDVSEFKENFDKGLRRDIPITEGHESFDEKPAVGWFVELIDRGANGLFATVEWTSKGKTLLAEKAYKYFSPEFYSEYEDPETRAIYENVLVGGALTNKPYFKELEAVVLSEQIIKKQLNFSDMDLQAILAKKVEDLSQEEKNFLRENKGQLNDEQLASFGSVFEDEKPNEEKPAETPEEKPEEEETPAEKSAEAPVETIAEAPTETPAEETPAEAPVETPAGDPVNASEFKMNEKGMVEMTPAQAKALATKANAGYEASEKLRKAEVKTFSDKLIFSAQNAKGKILPKHEQKVFSFMLGLTEAQRKTFAEIVDSIPNNGQMFSEQGSGQAVEGSAFSEIDSKAKKLMSENAGLNYADAVNKVCSEDKELAARYEKEL